MSGTDKVGSAKGGEEFGNCGVNYSGRDGVGY